MPLTSSARPESGTHSRLSIVEDGYGDYNSAYVDWVRDLGARWDGDGSEIVMVAGILDILTADGIVEMWQATAVALVFGFVTEYTYTRVPSFEDKREWGPMSTAPAFGRRVAAARRLYRVSGARQVIERHYGSLQRETRGARA